MKIFSFFYSEKSFFTKIRKTQLLPNKKSSLQYTLLGMTTRGFETERSYPDSACLFFSILKLDSFKKLNRAGRIWENSQTHPIYILFLFLFFNFKFFIFSFYFYYIKINIFHKNKKIMNFYILFIKKHYNNNNYLY